MLVAELKHWREIILEIGDAIWPHQWVELKSATKGESKRGPVFWVHQTYFRITCATYGLCGQYQSYVSD